jgi:DNA-binding NtrC family response regulator
MQPPPCPNRCPGVLVVDDDVAVRSLLGAALPRLDFTVWLAESGAEALELYRRYRDEIAVVLLDVLMPGLDGPATLAALQKENPGVRHLFMSGYAGGSALQLAGLDSSDFLAKPFTLAEVEAALRRALA